MIPAPIVILLDACVLYPAPIRDLLLSLAAEGLFRPKWTKEINSEWIRNLRANRPDLPEEKLWQTVNAMNWAFPDAQVENYEALIPGLSLPDQNDRHVLAAAIRGRAEIITTFNLKDFPKEKVQYFDIEIHHPDQLISILFERSPKKSCKSFQKMLARLRQPKLSKSTVLKTLEKCGISASSELIQKTC